VFVAIGLGLLFALAARLRYFLRSDFPLNDGGLFLLMAKEILREGFALPAFTAYNGEGIPFAYPPLAFYIAAALASLTGVELVVLVRYLPLIANLLTVVAVALLARSLLASRQALLLAPTLFALMPRSYEWLVMGGGLTRSFGMLFAVLALIGARDLFAAPTVRRVLWSGALAACALSAHLEHGFFAIYSLALFFLCYGRTRRAALALGLVLLLVLGLSAPWWATVLIRHGATPYLAASGTAGWSTLERAWAALLHFVFSDRPLLTLLGGTAALGAIACFLRSAPLLPTWLALIFVLTPRSAPTSATVVVALLAAIGLAEVVGRGLQLARSDRARVAADGMSRRWPALALAHRWSPAIIGVALALSAAIVFTQWSKLHPSQTALDSLQPAEREAMRWIAANTPMDSTFLVLASTFSWEEDHVGEWFPVLAERRSVLTVQGTEWLPGAMHARRTCMFWDVRAQAMTDLNTLDAWARERGVGYSHVYLSKTMRVPVDPRNLRLSLGASPQYRVVFENAGATVLERSTPVRPYQVHFGEPLVTPDCQTLADQPYEVQERFSAMYGPLAAWVWMVQHNRETGAPATTPAALPPAYAGRVFVARDCQTFADQPAAIQASFTALYGAAAPWVWAEQHTYEVREAPQACSAG
jgi:hypothetical protein